MVDLVPVKSSALTHVGYDDEKSQLHAVFPGGATYIYNDVPREVYDGLHKAESVGKYFSANIRSTYKGAYKVSAE